MEVVETEAVAAKPVTSEVFVDLLRTFLANEVERVERARHTGAGWEIWLQVELHMFVRWEVNGDIVRELKYGGNTKGRADFVLNSHQPKGRTVVEIKTNLSGENAFTFVKRLATDFEKQLDAPKGTRTVVEGIWVGTNPSKAIGQGEVLTVVEVVPNRIYLLHVGAA